MPYMSWKSDSPVMYGCTLLACKSGNKFIPKESSKLRHGLLESQTNKTGLILTQEFRLWGYILSTSYLRTCILKDRSTCLLQQQSSPVSIVSLCIVNACLPGVRIARGNNCCFHLVLVIQMPVINMNSIIIQTSSVFKIWKEEGSL